MEKIINHYFKGNTLLFSAFLNAILFITSYIIFSPCYQTNDDVFMMMYIRGIGTLNNQPIEHVLFINIILSKFLKYLVILFGRRIDVYTSFHLLVLFLTHSSLGHIYFERHRKFYHFLLYIIFFIIFGVYSIISLQFTVVAALSGFIGWLLITQSKLFLGIILVLLGSLIRLESVLMTLPFSIIYYFALNISNFKSNFKRGLLQLSRYFSTLIVITFICFILEYINIRYYNTNVQNYFTFNLMRGTILDFKIIEKSKEKDMILKEVKWSKNDYDMLMKFFFMDEEKYSIEKLSKIMSHYKKSYNITDLINHKIYHINGITFLTKWGLVFTIFSIVITVISLNKRNVFFLVITTGLLGLIIAWINYFLKYPPERVLFSLFFSGAFLLLLMLPETIQYHRYLHSICLIILILLSFYRIGILNNAVNSRLKDKEELKAVVKRLNPNKQELYIVWGGGLIYSGILPFSSLAYLDDMRLLGLGSLQRIPHNKNLLSAFGIHNIYTDIIDRPNVKLICGREYIEKYKKYLLENYSIDVNEKIIDILSVWSHI